MVVANGFGPRELRLGLCAVAFVYFALLMRHPQDKTFLHQVTWFTEATGLFPQADRFAVDYRLEAWTCADQQWHPLDPTPYFQIQADDKESRLQRVAHFYKRERVVMRAVDEYVYKGHLAGGDDGISGPIGGVKLVMIKKPIPPVGGEVERYHFDPLAPIPADAEELFYAPKSLREKRCGKPTSP
jgi:hypothetical protein